MKPSIIQQQGFVWLALPRESVVPLSLLEKSKENMIRRLFGTEKNTEALNSNLFSLFPKPFAGAIPKSGDPKKAAFFNGYEILDIKSNVMAKATGKIPLFENGSASVKLAVATKLLYTFNDVKHIVVDNEVLLEEYLNIVKPITKAPGFLDKLQNGALYVVTEVLQTHEFTVQDASDFAFEDSLNIESIKSYLNLKTETHVGKESDKKLAYKGETLVTFALKAFNIIYDKKKNQYTLSRTPIKITRSDSSIKGDILQMDDDIVNLE